MRIGMTALCGLILTASVGAASAQPAAAPAGLIVLTLSSTSFPDGGVLPKQNTAAADKPLSPQMSWDNAPPATVTFAIIAHDLDSAQNKTNVDNLHWCIFNIPATVHALPEGVPNVAQLPDGSIQIHTNPATIGFRGPAFPGPSYHHYSFELYALDTKVALGPDATREDLLKAMDGHILAKAADEARAHR